MNELKGDKPFTFCAKDLSMLKYIGDMIELGIDSFKIEGRLKDKNYVKNITTYYREMLDKYSEKSSSGKSTYFFSPNPEKSFNRGFTDYFLNKRCECYNFKSPKSLFDKYSSASLFNIIE